MGDICGVIGHSERTLNEISFDLTNQTFSYHCPICQKVIEKKPMLELNQEERIKLLEIGLNVQ